MWAGTCYAMWVGMCYAMCHAVPCPTPYAMCYAIFHVLCHMPCAMPYWMCYAICHVLCYVGWHVVCYNMESQPPWSPRPRHMCAQEIWRQRHHVLCLYYAMWSGMSYAVYYAMNYDVKSQLPYSSRPQKYVHSRLVVAIACAPRTALEWPLVLATWAFSFKLTAKHILTCVHSRRVEPTPRVPGTVLE
ncbi:unnamed protein product [Closterium sp. NIES-64]|nr:unnamed protein product [Closterium sp. NIES-64]